MVDGKKHRGMGVPSEDAALIGVPVNQGPAPPVCCFMVLDGHKGGKASTLARSLLCENVRTLLSDLGPSSTGADVTGALAASVPGLFPTVDAKVMHACEEGCTATVVFAWEDAGRVLISAANVGDSNAHAFHFESLTPHEAEPSREERDAQGPDLAPTVGVEPRHGDGLRRPVLHTTLTASHRIGEPAESSRLIEAGIDLLPGQTRVDGLMLSRFLGDREYKDTYPDALISTYVPGDPARDIRHVHCITP